MANTPRSRTDLLTLLADNITGAISEQDLRDLLVSIMGGFASITVISGLTSQSVGASPSLMTGWSADGLATGLTADYANGEITVDVDGTYFVDLSVCFSGTANKTFKMAVYKDIGAGYVNAGLPRVERKLGTGGDVGASSISGFVDLDATDSLAVYVWSTDGGTSFVPQEANFVVKRVG
jgi:hypothetical protein